MGTALKANNQAVMSLARRLIDDYWTESSDSWTYYDLGIVRMTAELTGLSETEVALQLKIELPSLIESITGVKLSDE